MRSSNGSPLNSDNLCDTFWLKKKQQKLNEIIKNKKIHQILNDWNKNRILRETNHTFLRNRSSEHGMFFGKVVYHRDYLKNNLISEDKFVDDKKGFKYFANNEEE